jgi:transposase, IS5 family
MHRHGQTHRPYEFGVKISLATTLNRSKGGQFIAHAKALPGNPYDCHTLATVIPQIETQIGANLASYFLRVAADIRVAARGAVLHSRAIRESLRRVVTVRLWRRAWSPWACG